MHQKQNMSLAERTLNRYCEECGYNKDAILFEICPENFPNVLTPNADTTDEPKPSQLNQEQYCFLVNGQNWLTNTNTTKIHFIVWESSQYH